MQNLVQQTILMHLPGKRKHTASGWTSFNAVCCTHNGETVDKHGRGGIMATSEGGVNYHCFNCQFKASWRPGIPLSRKFKNLLSWLGISSQDIDKLRLETLKLNQDNKTSHTKITAIPQFETVEWPPETRTLEELSMWYRMLPEELLTKQIVDVVDYIVKRKIDIKKYTFALSESTEVNLNRRVIIPFRYQDRMVGWTARIIDDKHKLKYYSSQPPGYVFNLDKQKQDNKFVVVCEGPFDAMSIDGVATLSNTISEQQARQIKMLQRQVIVVPDHDSSGLMQIEAALANNWSVSFPDWWETCKDVNDSVVRYGRLFTIKNILDRTVTSPVKIELMKKKHFKNAKDN
jgi:hypothetical protein